MREILLKLQFTSSPQDSSRDHIWTGSSWILGIPLWVMMTAVDRLPYYKRRNTSPAMCYTIARLISGISVWKQSGSKGHFKQRRRFPLHQRSLRTVPKISRKGDYANISTEQGQAGALKQICVSSLPGGAYVCETGHCDICDTLLPYCELYME